MSLSSKISTQTQQRPRAVSEPVGKRSVSLGDRLKTLLPRHRAERGGTKRDHGFWEEIDSEPERDAQPPQRYGIDGRQSRRSETADSDRITRWNTAKDIPPKPQGQTPAHRRAASVGIEALMALSPNRNRKWSWSPQEERLLVKSLHRAANGDDSGDEPMSGSLARQTRNLEAAIIASRRLSQARQIIEAAKEKRRLRRSLKESGDYLGVQGINPETGQLDIVTPSDSEHSTAGLETEKRIEDLKRVIKDAPSSDSPTIARAEREIQRVLTTVRNKTRKAEKEKEALKKAQSTIRWRRHTKQWSSAREPNLSPIAQSIANMSPSPSKRSSVNKGHAQEGILIDLSTPKLPPLDFDSLDHPPSAELSSSSGTIIRTPRPQSAVELSPSARELHENGISFGPFLKASDSKELNEPQKQAPVSPFTSRLADLKSDSRSSEHREFIPRHSFLDLRLPQRSDPGGRPSNRSSMKRWNQAGDLQSGKPPSQQSSLMKEIEESLQNLEQDSTIDHKEFFTMMMSQELRLPTLSEGNQLEECDLEFLLEPRTSAEHSIRTKNGRHQSHKTLPRKESGEAAFGDRFHFPIRKSTMGSRELDSVNPHLVENRVRSELEDLRDHLEQIDLPTPKTTQLTAEDVRMEKQVAIQSITNQEDVLTEDYASIPTTTTTGFAPRMLTSSPSQGQSQANHPRGRNPRPSTYIQSSKLNCLDGMEPLRNFQTKDAPNSLLSPEPQSKTLVTDTMSAKHLESAKQENQRTVSATYQQSKEDLPSDPHLSSSISRMFMSMVRQDKDVQDRKAHDEENMHRMVVAKVVNGEARPRDSRVRPSEPKEEPMGKFKGRSRKQQGPSPQPVKLQKRCIETNQKTLDLTRRIPGSYPNLLDAEDDIVDLFSAFRREGKRGVNRPGLWAALKEVSQTLRSNGFWLLRLYWAAIRPVFNVDSEYWMRNAGRTSTWKDCASLVLAAPAALFLMMSFV